MISKQHCFLVLFTCALAPLFLTAFVSAGQEKEKPNTGTAVDTWRQSLPAEAETEKVSDENSTLPVASNDDVKKTILSLEQSWIEAVKVGDADSLSQILSEDFTFVSQRALHVTDRSKYLEHAIRDLKLTSLDLEKVTVRLFGRTAVVGGQLKRKATAKGENVDGSYLFTDVWINRGGTWRVVSRHESMLPQQQ